MTWLIIGLGFGGNSVAARPLAEKGHTKSACSRPADAATAIRMDPAKSTWRLGHASCDPLAGICAASSRLTPLKDVFIASGSAVLGGGSVVHADQLHRAAPPFFTNPQWSELQEWAAVAAAPHYDTAEKMLGVQTAPREEPRPELLQEVGRHFNVESTFHRTPVGVFFGKAGATVPDPYFGGTGPDRTGCTYCGACMVGCREGAKNTLVKNYLWFAEKRGVEIHPERQVTDIRPLGAEDGSEGYVVTTEHPGAWLRKRRRTFTARGIVMSAGALGTNRLLAECKLSNALPRISDRLGELVRTNSESVLAVTLPEGMARPWNDVAISASVYPQPDTHIEFVTYGRHGDFMALLYTLLTGDGTRLTRPLLWLGQVLRHPLTFLKTLWPIGWSRRSVLLLVMQSLDNAIAFRARRGWFGRVSLTTEQDPEKPNPTFIDVGNRAAEWLAQRTGGYAQSMLLEAWANIPTTAHILGGAVIGRDAASGVVDQNSRLFGYRNFLVCDGSTVPANPGVNPSLTITAMSEHAMSQVPAKGTATSA